MLRLSSLFLAATLLSGCAPAWFSDATNSPDCPENTTPSGSCPATDTLCGYLENTGDSHRVPLHRACRCNAGGVQWECQLGTPVVDASTDAGD